MAALAASVSLMANALPTDVPAVASTPSIGSSLQAPAAAQSPIDFQGFVRVIDGDTVELWLDGRRTGVGVLGIDAPQGNTPCGREATNALRRLVAGGLKLEEDPDPSVRLDGTRRKLYHATTRAGLSVADELVNSGLARGDGRGRDSTKLRDLQSRVQALAQGCLWQAPRTPGNRSSSLTSDSTAPASQGPAAAPSAVTTQGGFVVDVIAANLTVPTAMAVLPDGRILIAEKNGIVRLHKNGALQTAPFLDIRDRVNDYWDHGLLGMAADPNFATNGYIYVGYTYENDPLAYDGTKTARVARYTAVGDAASAATEQVVLGTTVGASCEDFPAGTDCIPADGVSHGMGAIEFAPDGTMFVDFGDASSFTVASDLSLRAQNLDSFAGKVVHVSPTGAGIATNPFWNGSASANRSKIWAYGVRNAFRMDIDSASGLPYIGDVGWNYWEEIDVATRGANLGWPCYEGNFRQGDFEPRPACQSLYSQGTGAVRFPLLAYDHCQLVCGSTSVTGGVFYNGTGYPAQFQGLYFYGDYAQGFIRYLKADSNHNLVPGSVGTLATEADGPVDFAIGPDGNIYYLAINTGELRRIRFGGNTTYLSDLVWTSMTNGWGPAEKDKSNGETGTGDGRTITLNGTAFAKGLGVHAGSDIRYALNGSCLTFRAQVGVDDEVGSNGSVVFQVFGDTTKLYDSGLMTGTTLTKSVSVDLTGATALRLVVTDSGNGNAYDHADWADARLECSGPDTTPPTVSSVFPTEGATGVAVGASVRAVFSEAMDPATVNTSTFTLTKAGTPIAGSVVYDVPGTAATLDPTANLEPGTVYTATIKGGTTGAKDATGNPLASDKVWTFTTAAASGSVTYLSDLTWTSATNGWGPAEKDKSNGETAAGDGRTITLNGQTFAKGLGVHANSDVRYALSGACRTLQAQVGIDDEVGANGGVVFQVWGDASQLYDSGLMTGNTATKQVNVDLTGRSQLRLVVTDGGNTNAYDHADWADARFDCGGGPPPPPPGLFSAPTSFPTGTNPHGVAIADINADGKFDIVAANAGSNNVGVRLGNGDGTFNGVTAFAVGTTPKMVAVGDLNGDAKPDLVTPDQDSHTMSVLLGTGTGTFGSATSYAMCSRPHDAALSDFNSDGRLDVAIACWGGSVVSVRLGTGTGTFGAKVDYTAGTAPHSITVGDFDADGKKDLAVANHGSANVSVLKGVGDGTFTLAANYGVGNGPHSIRSADLNDDGKLDLVSADDASDQVSVLIGNGNGTFNPSLSYLTGHTPKGVVIGDVNGDGKRDIVTANTGNNYPTCCSPGGDTVTVLLGVGDGTFGAGGPYTAGTTPFNGALADLDGDNDLDLATANWDSGDVTILLNRSVSGPDTTPPSVTTTAPAAGATGVAATTNITATFSEAIDPATVSGSTFTLAKAGAPVAATVSYDVAARTATLDPTPNLDASGVYTATVKGGASGVKDLAGNALAADKVWSFTIAAAGGTVTYLSDLTWTAMTNGWGPVEKDRSNGEQGAADGRAITLNGVTFAKGLGTHANSDVRFALSGSCPTFTAQVGVDDEVGGSGSVTFQVFGDTTQLYDSGVMTGATATRSVSVDLTGRSELRLVVAGGPTIDYDHADWADAKLTCTGNTPPVPTITQPASTLTYKVGDTVNFAGSATDAEDGTIPPSGLSWQLIIHHCPGGLCHTHFSGLPGSSFTAPDHEDPSHLEIRLTATDSAGASASTSVIINPQTVQVTLATSPSGLTVTFSGQSGTAPYTVNATVGGTRTVGVTSPQNGHTFVSWSDGGAQSHNVTIGNTNVTYTATFTP